MLLKSLRPLFPYLRKYQSSYWIGAVCLVLTNGVWILFPQVIHRAIDDLTKGSYRHTLATYGLMLLAIAGAKGIFQFLTRWILIGISRDIEFDLRNDLFPTWNASLIPTINAPAPATSWRAPPTI